MSAHVYRRPYDYALNLRLQARKRLGVGGRNIVEAAGSVSIALSLLGDGSALLSADGAVSSAVTIAGDGASIANADSSIALSFALSGDAAAIAEADGSTALVSALAAESEGLVFEQLHSRFGADDGAEGANTQLAAEDVDVSLGKEATVRLRQQLDLTGHLTALSGRLYFKRVGDPDTEWEALAPSPLAFMFHANLYNLWWPHKRNITLDGTNTYIKAIADPYGAHGVDWLGPATETNGPVWIPSDAHFNDHASLLVNFGVGQFKLVGDDIGSAWNGLHDYANNDSHVFIVVRYLTESGNLRLRLGNGDPANGSRIGWSFTDGSSGTTVTSLIRHNTTDAAQNMTAGSAGLIGNTRVIRCSNYANLQEIEISGVGTSSEALVSPTQPVENSWNSFVLWTGGSSNWKLAAVATYVGSLTSQEISDRMAGLASMFGAVT